MEHTGLPCRFKRVFFIGFNKTGTVSLEAAMTLLGFRARHGGWELHENVTRALAEGSAPLRYVEPDLNVFLDSDVLKDNFIALDRAYSGSGFVLQTRDRERWLASRLTHYARYLIDKKQPKRKYHDGWRWTQETPGEWLKEWDIHHHLVRQYFRGQRNFLEMNVESGDGFAVLCPWLGVSTPAAQFPHLNKT